MRIVSCGDKNSKFNLGGKANSLLKLSNNGVNVPEFFVVTADAYREFLVDNNLIDTISKKDYKKIQRDIDNANFSDKLAKEILDRYDELGLKLVSVRSSASNEDGKDKSFAGQYETFLDVDREHLLDRIKDCWKSLYEDNVIAYNDGDDSALFSMNVIIQRMIEADYAGVAFSLDPTSNSKNYSITEVVEGLGEKLVSGQVTPTKFFIRRETGRADLVQGDTTLSDEIISNLEKTLLKIEKIYGLPVDVEWCLENDELFIVQTRPITAFNNPSIPFTKMLSRERALLEIEPYFRGEYDGIKRLTRGLYYFKALFIYNSERGVVDYYYNHLDLEEHPANIYHYMDLDFDNTKRLYDEAVKSAEYLDDVVDNGRDINYNEYIKHTGNLQPFSSLGELVGTGDFDATNRVRKLLTGFRKRYDYIIYKANEYLVERAKQTLDKDKQDYTNFITTEEFLTGNIPDASTLQKRSRGYIYFDGELIVATSIEDWLRKNNIIIKTNSGTEENAAIKGDTAYGGKVTGVVRLIFNRNDFDKFNDGDIIVTTMTTPKFTPILQRAAAIITDEGGLTCHAAIIARELKVPSVIGCKNATDVLGDGMIVEVDADKGVVNVLDE